ncbi:PAS domain-containing protein [Pseudodesulfovibrio cashew]|uniref:PAS domain-containing protein n=1 Tax=Pseudodesulfovibrio cashew TaxID=2678688 RepID=A0A6I6JRH7_9BACT|nr:HD domain-containing phosphohydrolase [Pseudodesulfovibrio cashew]QGY40204.1 PAS domain-containing protein [Pseudodesulfovibrio cashew]
MTKRNDTVGVPRGIGGSNQKVKITVVLVFVLLFSAGVLFLANKAVKEKERVTLDHQEKRLGLLADSRARMVEAWLKNLSHQGDRLIKSDLFRLYAAEVDSVEGDLAGIFGAAATDGGDGDLPGVDLAAQLPMMQNMLREFSDYSGFVKARILNRKGQAYIATDGYLPPLNDGQLKQARAAVEQGSPRFSPLRRTPKGIEMDVYVPVYSPEAQAGDDKPVGALMMTRQVSGEITDLLANSSLSAKGDQTRMMQRDDDRFFEVAPWTVEGFSPVTAELSPDERGNIPFGPRTSLSDMGRVVFSEGVRVAGPEWWIVQEVDGMDAMAPILAFNNTVYLLAGLGIVTALLAAGLAWWVLTGVQSRRVAEEFRSLANQIDDQKRFIDSINANVDEFITLKDTEGKFTYVNDAFAEAVGRDKEELIGMDVEAVFGFDTAKRLTAQDDIVYREGRKVTINEAVYLRSSKRQFQISKSQYCDQSNTCIGIVEVYRDMTEFVAAQERNKRLAQRAVEALASTIEAADPYLGGHTKLLAGLSSEVARLMRLPDAEVVEIETAANLSQIGKMFVPNEILTKPGKLDAEEMKVMEGHVEHAHRILKDIDIDEGVLTAIYQMSEHMDGSGYPRHLSGEEIIPPARILCALNAFCAMIRPRSYRGAKSAEEALDILSSENAKFDPAVVAALAEVLRTPSAERLLAGKA